MLYEQPQLLKVSENKRFLTREDGSLFFWIGDTAWELFHKLNREDADLYLENRAEKGFNVIQAVALAELDGIMTENAYGRKPLLQNSLHAYDPTLPDITGDSSGGYSYWNHVDYIVKKAQSLGLYIGFVCTWGDKYNQMNGKGPELFNAQNAEFYGKWLGSRYKDKNNIIWILGGDRILETDLHYEVNRALAQGLKAGDDGKHLITFHPAGCLSSSNYFHNEDWLDFNMIQSSHFALGSELNKYNYLMIESDYQKLPAKPILEGEPRYEDHPISFDPQNGYFDDFDVRQATYWAVFSGSCGITYGHSSIWSMNTQPDAYFIMHWKDALDRLGASQMKHLKKLIEMKPIIDSFPDNSLIAQNYDGANHLCALRGKDFAFIYSPNGLKICVFLNELHSNMIKASWYNPRTGTSSILGECKRIEKTEFTPPTCGRGNDWVLILEQL